MAPPPLKKASFGNLSQLVNCDVTCHKRYGMFGMGHLTCNRQHMTCNSQYVTFGLYRINNTKPSQQTMSPLFELSMKCPTKTVCLDTSARD